jgi:hypothetical protein
MSNRIESALAASVLALALAVAAISPAAAQSGPTPLQKFLGSIGILELPREEPDYRERPPLVVPPSSALITPRNPGDIAINNPDWPTDHDSFRGRRAGEIADEARSDEEFYSGRPLRPNELNRPAKLSKQEQQKRNADAARPEAETAGDEYAARREVYSPAKLGFKGWGSKKEETVVFTGEPERRTLTEPPPGLRTPSSDAPYGIVTATPGPPKPTTFFDRTASPDDHNSRKK